MGSYAIKERLVHWDLLASSSEEEEDKAFVRFACSVHDGYAVNAEEEEDLYGRLLAYEEEDLACIEDCNRLGEEHVDGAGEQVR